MNISVQYELMAVMNLWVNVSVMYFVFASVEKVDFLYRERNHDLLVYRHLTECNLTARLHHWVSTSSFCSFLQFSVQRCWRQNSFNTQTEFGHYVDFCLFKSWKTLWCFTVSDSSARFYKIGCTWKSDMSHMPLYLYILNNCAYELLHHLLYLL